MHEVFTRRTCECASCKQCMMHVYLSTALMTERTSTRARTYTNTSSLRWCGFVAENAPRENKATVTRENERNVFFCCCCFWRYSHADPESLFVMVKRFAIAVYEHPGLCRKLLKLLPRATGFQQSFSQKDSSCIILKFLYDEDHSRKKNRIEKVLPLKNSPFCR